MLIHKYNNFRFFCHNFGKYDAIFIYGVLLEINENLGKEYYTLNPIFRESTLIKLDIRLKVNRNNYIKLTFIEILNLLGKILEK